LGPGIGIGDELILAVLPKWLQATRPDLEVSVLSAYPGLWDEIQGVCERLSYTEHASLLRALRGEPPYDGFDLRILGDFEAPELYRGVAWEGALPHYLELSLGNRSAFYLDNRGRRLYRLHHFVPYAENYYFALDQLARELDLRTDGERFGGIVAGEAERPDDGIEVFVSPFTSKYDPSAPYWSRLLGGLVQGGGRPVRLVLDPGKNCQTERFSAKLAESLRPRVGPEVQVELAPADQRLGLSLAGVFRHLRHAHLVVCADSFAAHAAPLCGCTTLVIARAGLESWRVPHPRSFYLDGEAPVDRVSQAMRLIVAEFRHPPSPTERWARSSRAESRLATVTRELERALECPNREHRRDIRGLYDEFRDLHGAVVAAATEWPESRAVLFNQGLAETPSPLPDDGRANPDPLALRHLRDVLERWRNTNLCKYLRALVPEPEPVAADH
jgi:hypothetical protein